MNKRGKSILAMVLVSLMIATLMSGCFGRERDPEDTVKTSTTTETSESHINEIKQKETVVAVSEETTTESIPEIIAVESEAPVETEELRPTVTPLPVPVETTRTSEVTTTATEVTTPTTTVPDGGTSAEGSSEGSSGSPNDPVPGTEDVPGSETEPEVVLPCDIFDMSHWKIQLPSASLTGGTIKEVDPSDIVAGYYDEYFYAEDDHVVFHCPVDGYKTANTTYCRSELREMLDENDKTLNWSLHGTHSLTTTQAVTTVPSSGKVITSQIHGVTATGGNANPLVKVAYDYTQKCVYVMFKQTKDGSADRNYYFYNVELGQKYTTYIKVTDGVLYVTISSNGTSETFTYDFFSADPTWDDIFYYFKLGNYVLDDTEDYEGECADVSTYDATIYHNEESEMVAIEGFTLQQGHSYTLNLGNRVSLTPIFTPVDTTNQSIIWSNLTNNGHVYVDNKGNVTGSSLGTDTIRATSAEDNSLYYDCEITVAEATVTEPTLVYENDFEDANDVFADSGDDGWYYDTTNTYGTVTVDSETSNKVLKIVDNSTAGNGYATLFFPKQTGITTISYKIRFDAIPDTTNDSVYMQVENDSGNIHNDGYQVCRVSSNNKNTAGTDAINGITRYTYTSGYLSPDDADINEKTEFTVGQWKEITMITTPSDSSSTANTTDYYIDGYYIGSAANTSVQTSINKFCLFAGKADTLTVSIDDFKVYSGAKKPEAISPTSMTFSSLPSTMKVGNSVEVLASAAPTGSDASVTMTKVSGDDCLAFSSDGWITAISAGTMTFKVSSTYNTSLYTQYTIEVLDSDNIISVEYMELDNNDVVIHNGETYQIGVNIYPEDATEQSVRYSISSGSSVISVSESGLITSLGTGSAVVKVISLDNSDIYELFYIQVVNAVNNGDLILEDQFTDGILNTSYWIKSTATDTSITESNGILSISDASTAGQPKVYATFDTMYGTYSIQYKIRIDSQTSGGIRNAFGTGTITSTGSEAFTVRNSISSNQFTTSTATDSGYSSISDYTYTVGDWAVITLVTTTNDGTSKANTTDVYIDGNLVADGLSNKVVYNTMDKLIFATGTADVIDYSLDYVRIWAGDYSDAPTFTEETVDTSADDGTYESIYSEDFESGSVQTGATLTGSSIIDYNDDSHDGGKVLYYKDESDTATLKSLFNLGGDKSGKITVSFDFMILDDAIYKKSSDNTYTASTFTFSVGSNSETGGSTTSSKNEFFRFKTSPSAASDGSSVTSRKYEMRGGDKTATPSYTPSGYEYSLGDWTNVKIVIDTTTKTCDVYVDGTLIAENQPMSCTNDAGCAMDSIDNIAFMTGTGDLTELYLDNIKVYKEATDDFQSDSDDYSSLVYSEDFELGVVQSSTTLTGSSIIDYADDSHDGDKVLYYNDVSSSDTYKALFKLGDNLSGKVTVSFDFMILDDPIYEKSTDTYSASTFTFSVGSTTETGGSTTSSANEFFRFKTSPSVGTVNGVNTITSRKYEMRGGNSSTTPSYKPDGYEYSLNQWTNVKIVINTTTKTCDVYVGGTLIAEDRPMSCSNTTYTCAMDSIDNIAFMTGSKDLTKVYLDNIKVYNKTTD